MPAIKPDAPIMGKLHGDLTEDALVKFLRLKPTLNDCAAFFNVSTSTIEKYCKRKKGLKFSDLREQSMAHTRNALVQKALQMALNGNTVMLIFCLKNICKWTDKIDHTISSDEKQLKLAYSPNTIVDAEKIDIRKELEEEGYREEEEENENKN